MPSNRTNKSQALSRALGSQSSSFDKHKNAEYEYTFVRAVVDAMSNNNNYQYNTGGDGNSEVSITNNNNYYPNSGLIVNGNNALYNIYSKKQNVSTHSNTPPIDNRFKRFGDSYFRLQHSNSPAFTMQTTSVVKKNLQTPRYYEEQIISIDDLLNQRYNVTKLFKQSSASNPGGVNDVSPQFMTRKTKKRLGSPRNHDPLSERATVVPATSLQINIGVNNNTKSKANSQDSSRNVRSAGSPRRGLALTRNSKDIYASRPKTSSNESQRLSPGLVSFVHLSAPQGPSFKKSSKNKIEPNDENMITRYRLSLSQHARPKTSPASPERSNINSANTSDDAITKRQESPKPKRRIKTTASRLDAKISKAFPPPPPPSRNSGNISPVGASIVNNKGIEGKTEMRENPGSLTLSVFLPRERADSRKCSRADETIPKEKSGPVFVPTETDGLKSSRVLDDNVSEQHNQATTFRYINADIQSRSFSSIENESIDYCDESTKQKEDPLNRCLREIIGQDIEVSLLKSDAVKDQVSTTEDTALESGRNSRRAIHCEIFGPELCQDCQRRYDESEVAAWQGKNYPYTTANSNHMTPQHSASSQRSSTEYNHASKSFPKINADSSSFRGSSLQLSGLKQRQFLTFAASSSRSNDSPTLLHQDHKIGSRIWQSSAPVMAHKGKKQIAY